MARNPKAAQKARRRRERSWRWNAHTKVRRAVTVSVGADTTGAEAKLEALAGMPSVRITHHVLIDEVRADWKDADTTEAEAKLANIISMHADAMVRGEYDATAE
jgi:hypothetical protein